MICDVKQAMANYAAQQAAEASKPVEADLSITDAVTSTDFSDEPLWHVSPIHIAPLHPETSIVSTIGTVGSALTCDNDSASSLNSLLEPDSPCTLTGELSSSPTYPISMPISPPVLTLDLDISDSLDPLGFFDLSIDLLVQPSATNGSNFSPSELSSVEFTTPSCPARGHASINVIGYADATEPAATLSLDSSASGPLVYPAAPAIDDSEVVRKLSDARPVVASASHVVYEDGSITKPTVAEPFFGYGIMIDVIPQPYGTTTVMNREYHIRMVPTLRQSKLMKSLCKAKRTLQKLGRLVCGRRY
ncbi:hypothetical protein CAUPRSCDRAFT_11336 [Caulochytrium protostelioides]|uniref:Uncharacterized protein n=2 Tax=Caulochytrium protostelioides TaxID=1555241 RepID=A0A4P9X008_9FUNG|nr:hypothetical protein CAUPRSCDRAFT_11336 [Caulochytrium protostelioides]